MMNNYCNIIRNSELTKLPLAFNVTSLMLQMYVPPKLVPALGQTLQYTHNETSWRSRPKDLRPHRDNSEMVRLPYSQNTTFSRTHSPLVSSFSINYCTKE